MKRPHGQRANLSSFDVELETIKNAIGLRIRQVRGVRTQPQFAADYDIGHSSLMRWEKGETQPDATFLAALVMREGVDANWLLLGVGQPKLKTDEAPGPALTEEDMDLLLDCYAAGELILQDHNMTATHEEKKAATIKMFHRQKAGGRSLSPGVLVKRTLDSHKNQA